MDMVEKVATALLEEDPTREGHYTWRHYEGAARAAIAAMREPAVEMVSGLGRLLAAADTDPPLIEKWHAMIDAALGEGE